MDALYPEIFGSELVSVPDGSFDMICFRSSILVRFELILPLLRLDWLVACCFDCPENGGKWLGR